jgi:hypothetical protein
VVPMSKSIAIHKGAVSINRYEVTTQSEHDTAYYEPGYLYQLESATQVVPKAKKHLPNIHLYTTNETSNYLTFEDNQMVQSPKARLKLSNQNALLSIMSHDDLEGIK